MKRFLISCLVLLTVAGTITVHAVEVSLSAEEQKLYDMIMQYRAENGLKPIPLSPSLTYVAQTHARDLQNHPPTGECNMHSWSDAGKWSPVCYTDDPTDAQKKGMWNKPRELTTYPGAGYEISYMSTSGATARSAINGWKGSSGHNAVMINLNVWSKHEWRAIGIGIYQDYAVVWFGEEDDPGSKKPTQQVKPQQAPVVTVPSKPQQTKPQSQSNEMEQRLQAMEQRLQNMQNEQAQTAQKAATDERDAKITQQNNEIKALKAEKEKLQKELKKSKEKQEAVQKEPKAPKQPKDRSNSWLNRFYDYSGFSSLSYFSAGYTYSCMSNSHMINVSLLDFRASLFGASLLNMEMSVSPFNKRFSYKPNIRIYIPVAKCFSIVPYGGAEIDASYLGKYFDKNYTYDVQNDFYISAVGGLALNLTAARHVPMEIFAEYRHPVLIPTAGAVNPKGVYVGAKIYFGSVFYKK